MIEYQIHILRNVVDGIDFEGVDTTLAKIPPHDCPALTLLRL